MNHYLLTLVDLSNPALLVGLAGGILMIGYLGTLWYTTAARASFEGKRNRLELDALNLQIKTLNLKAQAA